MNRDDFLRDRYWDRPIFQEVGSKVVRIVLHLSPREPDSIRWFEKQIGLPAFDRLGEV